MSEKRKAAAKKGDELLDSRQKRRFAQLSAIEKALVRKLLDMMAKELNETDGRITSKKGFVSLANAVDRVFDEVEASRMENFIKGTAKDLKDLLEFNGRYYKALKAAPEDRYKAIKEAVDSQMRKRLGLDGDNGIVRKGYLDQLFRTEPARDEVKKMVAKAVAGGVPMRKLRKEIRVKVAGTDEAAGVLERHIGTVVLDAYQQADALTNKEFANRLGLGYFIYSGGLIETSREFCRKRNNKVFSTEEAEKWHEDTTLPRTKAEKDSGTVTDYDPLVDRGRWNCRHRILFITPEEAQMRRPDLADGPAKPMPKAPPVFPGAQRVPDPDRNVTSAQQVAELAKQAAPQLDRLSKDIATRFASKVTPINLKSIGSITRKAVNEEKGNYNEIKDGVRNTIVADLDKHKDILEELKSTPIFWRHKEQRADQDPLGYSGNIINVIMDNGAIGEVQLNTAGMIFAKEKEEDARRTLGNEVYDMIAKATGMPGGLGHAFYEEWRLLAPLKPKSPKQLARMRWIEQESRAYYARFR